ncbi:hypothetical protein SLS62_008556 [Diatrype stigma]|uniref:Proteasome inhibitor PI31 subunit n=1 Tax=Diatrype stigma TaxID=117547 RepID=A0AAN9UK23_9PEZI
MSPPTAATNPLEPAALLQRMADALPTHPRGDTTSDLSSSHEALALFAHAVMAALGFRLLGFDEDAPDEAGCRALAPRLPARWNASFNTYSFVYAHAQSALRFVVRVDRLGAKAEVRGLAAGDDRIARLEIVTRDFVSAAALPVRIALVGADARRRRSSAGTSSHGGGGEEEDAAELRNTAESTSSGEVEEDRSDLPRKLRDVMISEARVADLASLIKVQIVQKLLPSLQKEGYEEEPSPEDDRAAREDADETARRGGRGGAPPQPPAGGIPGRLPQPARPYPFDDPLDPQPRHPTVPSGDFPPPGFEDPYDINRPPRGSGGAGVLGGGRTPFGNIGQDDLNPPPLGPRDPFHPGGGVAGPGLPRPGGGRGMYPTFDDPLFGGGGGLGGMGMGGGDDLDDLQVPPGARYDPLGPGGVPRLGGRGGRGGGGNWPFGGGGGGGGGFGGFGGGDII